MRQVTSFVLVITLCFYIMETHGRPTNSTNQRALITRQRRETELCKADVITTSWNTGKNGQLQVKIPDSVQVGDEIIVIVGFSGPVTSFRAWSYCMSVDNQLNEEDNEADIMLTTLQNWMVAGQCSGPGVTMTFGYAMAYEEEASVEAIFMLVNDEDVDDVNQCLGEEEGGEEGEEDKEGGKEGGVVTGEVTCDKLFKVIANRPGQLQGYIEFLSPDNGESWDIEVGTDVAVENLVLDGVQKEIEPAECDEMEGRVHFFTKQQKLVKGQNVRVTFNLNYDQNVITSKPNIEGVAVFVGAEEIYCGQLAECPDEAGEEEEEEEEGGEEGKEEEEVGEEGEEEEEEEED